jgi:acetyl-CoA carboxylase carboxyl transferase subunit beta
VKNIFSKRKEQLSRFKSFLNKSDNLSIKKKVPHDVIQVCDSCQEPVTLSELAKNSYVCESCGYHFKISANERIRQLIDEGTFKEVDSKATSLNPDQFPGYQKKLDKAKQETGHQEAFVCGVGRIKKQRVCLGVLDSNFIMGSMGHVVGDKVTRLIEQATKKGYPLIIVSASGGARMQEGILSLIQMTKTSAALSLFEQAGGLYISVLTHPTTGGVSASFAMLGDINIAEPKALIGFAGKRVIEKTINETLPEEFQTAEFLLEKGFLDMIVPRYQLKETLFKLCQMHYPRRNQYGYKR